MLQSWVEAGGFPAHPEEEVKEALSGGKPLPLSSYLLLIFLSQSGIFTVHYLPLSFQGLRLLEQASKKWEEVQKLEEEVHHLETEGWGKFREAVVGSEAEGLYGLLRGVIFLSPPFPASCEKIPPYAQLPWFPCTCSRVYRT